MPKFTIEDVDKQIEEIRNRYRQPRPAEGFGMGQRSNVLQNLIDKARLKTKGKPGEVEPEV